MTTALTPTPAAPADLPPAAEAGFQQRLGLFDAAMLVAGTMIGSGIFIVSADIARDVGSSGWLLGVWVLTGLMTLMGALSYAELAAMMPHAGGQYVYLREAYSPLWGFLYGWTSFVVIQTGTIAAVGVAFAKFLGVLAPTLGTGQQAVLWEIRFEPRVLLLPLPWLAEPLEVFRRDQFAVTRGQIIAVACIALLTALNCRGVREGKWVQNVFGVAKTLALLVLIGVGLWLTASHAAIAANRADVWSGIFGTKAFKAASQLTGGGALAALMVAGGAMVGGLFSADAWGNVTYTAGEVRNPRRTLPLSLFLGTSVVIVLYLLANLAYLSSLPVEGDAKLAARLKELAAKANTPSKRAEVDAEYQKATYKLGVSQARDDRVGTAVMELAWPGYGAACMALAIMVSTFGCLNGLILMGARLTYAMARDGLFFSGVGRLNGRGVPAVGLLLQAGWAILLVFSGTYSELLDYVIFAALLFYALTVGALFVLRFTRPAAERPYRAFGYPLLPALYVVLCLLIMVDLLIVRPVYTWPGLLLVLTGIPVYFLWRLRSGARPVSP
jgi:APA family basic amino acid/polyamine antiporter